MDKPTKVRAVFEKVIPALTEPELDRLLAYGEGMLFRIHQEKALPPLAPDTGQSEVRPSA